MRHNGLRTCLLATPLHPPMHDGKAVSFAILTSDAFGGPTADGIDDFGWTFNGAEAVT